MSRDIRSPKFSDVVGRVSPATVAKPSNPNDWPDTWDIWFEHVKDLRSTTPEAARFNARMAARKAIRESSPFTPGDVVYVGKGTKNDRTEVKRALVLDVLLEWSEYSGYYVLKYTVTEATKKGAWSQKWTRTYPGPISRGYLAVKEGRADVIA